MSLRDIGDLGPFCDRCGAPDAVPVGEFLGEQVYLCANCDEEAAADWYDEIEPWKDDELDDWPL